MFLRRFLREVDGVSKTETVSLRRIWCLRQIRCLQNGDDVFETGGGDLSEMEMVFPSGDGVFETERVSLEQLYTPVDITGTLITLPVVSTGE